MKASLILMGLLSLAAQAHADIQCTAPGLAGNTKIEISGRINKFGNTNAKLQLIATGPTQISLYNVTVDHNTSPLFDQTENIQIVGTTDDGKSIDIKLAGFYGCGALIVTGDGMITINNVPINVNSCTGDLF